MRVLLFTGKGGVGKTSIAAATALRTAADGLRTLVLSTDPAHSLADVFDQPVGDDPTPIAPRLQAAQLDAQARLEDNWRHIQSYLIALLRWGGVGDVEAEELSVLPGLEEIFSLIDVRRHADAGEHDVLVVDCAPTAETLRLLSLPDALGWYLERVFPLERVFSRVVRPLLGEATSLPLPDEHLLPSVERLHDHLEGVRSLLADAATTSVRLVVNAERVVIAEARRTYTHLSLFGFHVDAVVVNRLLPAAVTDPWFDRWKAVQAAHLADIRDGFGDVPVRTAPLFDDELVGLEPLGRLAQEVYGDRAAHGILHQGRPMTFDRTSEDGWRLSLALPFTGREDVEAFQRGDELYVRIGSATRSIMLPAALRRCQVSAAGLRDGRLVVDFAPRPQLRRGQAADLPR